MLNGNNIVGIVEFMEGEICFFCISNGSRNLIVDGFVLVQFKRLINRFRDLLNGFLNFYLHHYSSNLHSNDKSLTFNI